MACQIVPRYPSHPATAANGIQAAAHAPVCGITPTTYSTRKIRNTAKAANPARFHPPLGLRLPSVGVASDKVWPPARVKLRDPRRLDATPPNSSPRYGRESQVSLVVDHYLIDVPKVVLPALEAIDQELRSGADLRHIEQVKSGVGRRSSDGTRNHESAEQPTALQASGRPAGRAVWWVQEPRPSPPNAVLVDGL